MVAFNDFQIEISNACTQNMMNSLAVHGIEIKVKESSIAIFQLLRMQKQILFRTAYKNRPLKKHLMKSEN